jgi:hypothetical protein
MSLSASGRTLSREAQGATGAHAAHPSLEAANEKDIPSRLETYRGAALRRDCYKKTGTDITISAGARTYGDRTRSTISAEDRERLGQTAYKRSLAYQQLGISPADVQCAPFVRGDLRRIARLLNQGRATDEPLSGLLPTGAPPGGAPAARQLSKVCASTI